MTAAQKRVAIAKDVIKQINLGKTRIKRGVWVNPKNIDKDHEGHVPVNQAALLKRGVECKCCAVGAAVVSAIRLFNSVDCRSYMLDDDTLTKWFSRHQVDLIESAFEVGAGLVDAAEVLGDGSVGFGKRIKNNESRAIAIFKNIIKNKGEFVP